MLYNLTLTLVRIARFRWGFQMLLRLCARFATPFALLTDDNVPRRTIQLELIDFYAKFQLVFTAVQRFKQVLLLILQLFHNYFYWFFFEGGTGRRQLVLFFTRLS